MKRVGENEMLRSGIVAATLILAVSAGIAATSAIDQRQSIMKGLGKHTKETAAMLKGEAAFDLGKVQAALKSYEDASQKMPGLFPADSKTGGDTTASPKIWQDPEGFKASFAKFEKDASAALSSIKDEASFKAAFPTVLKNCGSCHEAYRIKKG